MNEHRDDPEDYRLADKERVRKAMADIAAETNPASPAQGEPPRPNAMRLCAEQAEDEGLWFVASTAPEAYLQNALRELHAAVEASAQPLTDLPPMPQAIGWLGLFEPGGQREEVFTARQMQAYARAALSQGEPHAGSAEPVAPIVDRVKLALHGIDLEECSDADGWWETSTGAEFGAGRLAAVLAILTAPPQAGAKEAGALTDAETVLRELIACEDLRIRAGKISPVEPGCEKEVLMDEYRRRNRIAWNDARAILAKSGAGEARDALAQFGAWCIEELRGENIGSDINGGDAQDAMERLGLLQKVKVSEPCCEENCACAEYGDFPQDCYRLKPTVRAAMTTESPK